jgi:hypothetical protein
MFSPLLLPLLMLAGSTSGPRVTIGVDHARPVTLPPIAAPADPRGSDAVQAAAWTRAVERRNRVKARRVREITAGGWLSSRHSAIAF